MTELSQKVWLLARDKILMQLRFLNAVAPAVGFEENMGGGEVFLKPAPASNNTLNNTSNNISNKDDRNALMLLCYNPPYILNLYKREPPYIARLYLHMLMHCIFHHFFGYDKKDRQLWDVACDMAAENVILGLGLYGMELKRDKIRLEILGEYRKKLNTLTAMSIYKSLKKDALGITELMELGSYFKYDTHIGFSEESDGAETLELTKAQLDKISERIKAELGMPENRAGADNSILQSLNEATKAKYDYGEFLRKFCVSGEEIQVNDDEFDYIYYTYGLNIYGSMPLIEPLEYKDVNRIKEFVIAIDTSASCQGSIVRQFLTKTYEILKSSENFFRKVNIHIIQCDSIVRNVTKITNDDEFEDFVRNGRIDGFGGTDFRPVFDYVGRAIENKEFENLKGLIYFTDGYGVFPAGKPPYGFETAFVFLEDNYDKPPVPPWAVKLVLDTDTLED